jgi:NADH dehydrogenase/NADH:ubiquinone oxidoreductase subunit G
MDRLVSRASSLIAVSARKTALSENAGLVVPGLTFAEKLGMLVNFEGHIQKLGVALDYAPDFAPTAQRVRNAPNPISDWKVLEALIASIRGEEAVSCISVIRRMITESESSFSGIDLQNVGPLGLRLGEQPVR